MDDKQRQELALFRFSLIAPLVNGSLDTSVKEYLETVSAKTYDVPGLGKREFSPRTLLCWRSLYQQFGLEGLKGKERSDRGHRRRLSLDAQMFLTEAVRRNPKVTATTLYEQLVGARLLGSPPCSLSTVQRFVRNIEVPQPVQPERHRFAFPHANACWQSDVCAGPYLVTSGGERKQKAQLLVILDDASRLCVCGRFFPEANNQAFEAVFKAAILKRGVPQRLYVDNGRIFHSTQLKLICAQLGITLCHSTPYQPEGRGKVERFFRTVRQQCFARLEPDDLVSMEALNQRFTDYLEHTYHNRPHSSLNGQTPMQRFLADQELLRFISPERVERAFLHEEERRVGKDATISLARIIFEVPQIYVGRRVHVLFRPEDLSVAWLREDNGALLPIKPVCLTDNAVIYRRRQPDPIDYGALTRGEVH